MIARRRPVERGSSRLFVAVELPTHIQDALGATIERLRAELGGAFRWVSPAAIHLTLKFLGDVGPERVPALTTALESAAVAVEPFELRLEGSGVFPNRRSPSVVWAGIGGDAAAIEALRQAVELAMTGAGEAAETRTFRPHLTLARVRGRLEPSEAEALAARLGRVDHARVLPFRVDGVSLMQSELDRGGASYARLGRATLGAVSSAD